MTPAGTRRLILTRHAKSSWDNPEMSDFDRPLNRRGRIAARELGDFLASRGLEPEEVLCSSSERTRETWALVASAALESRPEIRLIDPLYHASSEAMLEVLKGATQPNVMMIGHNPGIGEFAGRLLAQPSLNPDFRRYPTAATAVITFSGEDWATTDWMSGSLVDWFIPTRLS